MKNLDLTILIDSRIEKIETSEAVDFAIIVYYNDSSFLDLLHNNNITYDVSTKDNCVLIHII